MRLGGPIKISDETPPREWANTVKEHGYSAAFSPVLDLTDEKKIKNYSQAAEEADIIIAEVGAWSNPISPDEKIRENAMALCKERLAVADMIGARCCVNISGSRGGKWDGPHPSNLTRETFDLIVDSVREIIDDVKPTRTFYTLETMPWMYPDSADSYVMLVNAIDRKRFAVHLDPVNLICSPQRYFDNASIIRDCFNKLGQHIKGCHAKDIILAEKLTTHLDECVPGTGALNYRVYLNEMNRLDPDTPLMLEHLKEAEEYAAAARHIRQVALELGMAV